MIYLAFSKCKCLLFPGMGLNFKLTQSCKCNFATKNKMKFLSTFKHSFSQLCSIDHWTVVVVVVHHSKRKDCKIKIFYFFFLIFIPCQLGTGENRSAGRRVGPTRPAHWRHNFTGLQNSNTNLIYFHILFSNI